MVGNRNEDYEQFKTIMEENTAGHDVEIRYGVPHSKIYPAVRLFYYDGFPKPDLITIVTYGISLAKHKDWSLEKPEVMLTVNSKSPNWMGFVGLFSDVARDESAYGPGDCFTVNFPVSDDSEMQGFCIGGPARLPINPITLSDKNVIIRSAIPIYIGEAKIAAGDKWESFFSRVGESHLHDVRRPDLSKS
jgi:hypothetical protein